MVIDPSWLLVAAWFFGCVVVWAAVGWIGRRRMRWGCAVAALTILAAGLYTLNELFPPPETQLSMPASNEMRKAERPPSVLRIRAMPNQVFYTRPVADALGSASKNPAEAN